MCHKECSQIHQCPAFREKYAKNVLPRKHLCRRLKKQKCKLEKKMDRQNCLWRELSRLDLCLNMNRGEGSGHMDSHALGNTLGLLISESGSSTTQLLLFWIFLLLWTPPSLQYSPSSCCPPLAAHKGPPGFNTCQNQINSLVNLENRRVWHLILRLHGKVVKSRWHISDFPVQKSISCVI